MTTPRKKIAWITLRHEPPYRSEAFKTGIEALGYAAVLRFPTHPDDVKQGDVVITWNLNPRYRKAAEYCKAGGGYLLVTENGYIPRHGSAEPFYALARDGHNGSGTWFVGGSDRWHSLGQTIYPMVQGRETGHILIANQRGIGSEIMKCPNNFADTTKARLARLYKMAGLPCPPIIIREHPGRHKHGVHLRDHLSNAKAVVTWASNTANLSCLVGVPSFRMAPYHVNSALHDDMQNLLTLPDTDREEGFSRLAWAQWSLSEITDGSAFRWALQDLDT